jgi:hypothetical protein
MLSAAMALLLVFGVVAGLSAPASQAQGATGGEPVLITDAAGQPLIEVTLDSFTPQFEGYDSSYAPDRGFEYALATVTVTNVGTAAYAANAYGFQLIDTEGFVNDSAWVMVDESVAPPMLDSTPIEPGASHTGSIVFQLLAGSEAAAITYSVTWDRVTFLAVNASIPDLGAVVEVLGPNGRPVLNVTIEEWLDPLPDVDASVQPSRGYHFAGAVVTIENVGSGTYSLDPYSFKMLDADGFEASGTSAYRPEPEIADLEYADLSSGDSVTGVVSFQVFNTSTPAFIVFETDDQYTMLSGFPDAPVLPSLADLPTVDAIELPDTSGTDGGEVAADVSPECAEVETWINDLFAALNENEALNFNVEDAVDMTTDELIEIREALETAQSDLEGTEPPALAEDFYLEFLDVVDFMIGSMNDLIEASENGDDLQPIVDDIVADETQLDEYFAEFEILTEACANLA